MKRHWQILLRTTLLGRLLVWSRQRGLLPSDVFIASYPRSGSTWLRFLLYEILTRQSGEFESVDRAIPDLGKHFEAPPLLPKGGRLIKIHEPYCQAYRKAVFLVRDARDVVVSEYSYQRMTGLYDKEFDYFLTDFLQGHVHRFGSWADHANSWMNSDLAQNGGVLLIRFEELRRETEATLNKILSFLGVSVNSGAIRTAIQNNSVEKMHQKEDAARQTVFRKFKKELRFVNKGAVGGWRQKLNSQQIEFLEQATHETLSRLGYLSN